MARTVAIGLQDFGDLIRKEYFYIDKTDFIREWWESGDSATLITRPRKYQRQQPDRKIIREGSRGVKEKFENLLRGDSLRIPVDEQIVYNQLNGNERAVWSLLLAGEYLKVLSYDKYEGIPDRKIPEYELALTNLEVSLMFQHMIFDWFAGAEAGIPRNRIRSYGFAFQGKEVLIG